MLFGHDLAVRWRLIRVTAYTLLACAVPAAWYTFATLGLVGWPRASSWFGTLLGFLGGGLILFEMLLWQRKRSRGKRWKFLFPGWTTRQWLYFHIVCGWVVLPVIVVHSGFALGGWLSAWTMILFLVVIASGVYGLLLQQWLPQRMLEEIPDETVAAEADDAIRKHIDEARLIVERLTPPIASDGSPTWQRPVVTEIPAVRLREFGESTLTPYLEYGRFIPGPGRTLRSPLSSRHEATLLFSRLRSELPEAAHRDLSRLEQLADIRRQWDNHRRLNWLLHGWLLVHAPISLMMVIFMIVHAVMAMKFW